MDKINVFMTGFLGTSWRSTVLAFLIAVGNLVMNGVSWKTALASAGIQAAGLILKDQQAHSTIDQVNASTREADKAAVQAEVQKGIKD